MARKVHVMLEDDIDGGEAVRTVEFSVDGANYEIDLNQANADALLKALAPYIDKARQVASSRSTGARRTSARRNPNRPNAQEIRDWAKGQGLKVSERGRIPAEVMEAWNNR